MSPARGAGPWVMHDTTTHPRKLFVNLPVRDLPRAVAFFTGLGFAFDARFTDASATCMIVSAEAYVMLLVEPRFKDFTTRELCDMRTHVEGLFCISASSRAEVDALVDKALATGGAPAMPPMDHGFMYGRSFLDPDGHHWEVMHMDMSAIPA